MSTHAEKLITWDNLIDEIINWPLGIGTLPGQWISRVAAKNAIMIATQCRSRHLPVPDLCYPADDGECWMDWHQADRTCAVVCQPSGKTVQGRGPAGGTISVWQDWNPKTFARWMTGGRNK
jgi:hypothetical protein